MNIVVNVNHPAHIHFYKYFIKEMEDRGHKILVTASNKEMSFKLLDLYKIPYIDIGSYGGKLFSKVMNIPRLYYNMIKQVKSFRPEIFTGVGSMRAAHVSAVFNKPCVIFDDTEHAILEHIFYLPFANYVFTPFYFKKNMGKNQIRYQSYHELAYLHPNWFMPDSGVLDTLGLKEGDPFFIIRLTSHSANHDIGVKGITNVENLVSFLTQHGRVLITSESDLPASLEKYKNSVSPEKFHDLLYYSTLYVGEGGTIASEAVSLGVHTVHISTAAKYQGLFHGLSKSGLYHTVDNDYDMMDIVKQLIALPNLKKIGMNKRKQLFCENMDATQFMVNVFENIERRGIMP